MTISWGELVVLMAFGADDAEDRIAGTIRVRDVNPLDDEFPDEDGMQVHPRLGRIAVRESELRVARRGKLVRLERLDGTVTAIFGAESVWLFGGRDATPTRYDARQSSFGWAGAEFVRRLPPSRWEGEDFTRLTGPIEASEFLGRPAWAFELAPPAHKPYPLQMIVDAATGILLRQANRDFGSFSEWTSIDTAADLPDSLFTWDGPARSAEDVEAERDAERRADVAERLAWVHEHGMAFRLPMQPELMLHERSDETGAFHLSFYATAHGSLLRRPLGDPVDETEVRYPHTYRWSDARWEWLLGTGDPLTDDQLASLKVQLASST